ncbi:hypothetical protein SCG7086_AW_00220 [Chlamydiales bacterium SCGC AG-110-P3]|nr:hypothetical protein SCG7086_AW_00220 [Chlamydiales bacterium SCGC AG-110-P3]
MLGSRTRIKALEKLLRLKHAVCIPVSVQDGASDEEQRKQEAWDKYLQEGGDPDANVLFVIIRQWGG